MKPADVDLVEQVRTLLHEYLTEDEDGSIASRNPITSVNEILRNGKIGRDNLKVQSLLKYSCAQLTILLVYIQILRHRPKSRGSDSEAV